MLLPAWERMISEVLLDGFVEQPVAKVTTIGHLPHPNLCCAYMYSIHIYKYDIGISWTGLNNLKCT